ncbi:hypothetical protein [Oceanobacillus sp. Castelsardo]|uniref:YhcN/YlaJ family sporulation lipoprotein n=1 Tax=Oceanobacillus sp. Castelsardo TaxID=1851204 RepID=UPI000839201C|nr:hypothetical protein [Oceanobacillus sp. Castelsardo]
MYKRKNFIVFGVLTLMLFGCSDNNALDNSNNDDTNTGTTPVRYESKQEQNDRQGITNESPRVQNTSPLSEKPDTGDSFTDPYTNEEAVYIYNELIKREEIMQAQVASTKDRIVVAVMFKKQHFNHDSKPNGNDIENMVREIVPNTRKDIVVYTDNIEWDKRKNDNARLKDRKNNE